MLHGGRVGSTARAADAEAVALVSDGRLVAIGVPDGEGRLRPSVVLEDPR